MENDLKKTLQEILAVVQRIEAKVNLSGEAAKTETQSFDQAAFRPPKKLSIREFLQDLGPTDAVQMTLALGFYAETYQGVPSFNKEDLEKLFRTAKESVPLNINDKVNMNIKNGHMMEADERKNAMKAWVVTRAGEQHVKSKFKKANDK